MRVIANLTLMINDGAGIDNASHPNTRQRADMGVVADKAAGRNIGFAADRCGRRNQRGERPRPPEDVGYLNLPDLIVSGSRKGLPAIRQFVVECPSHREPPQVLVCVSRLVYEEEFLNAQRQRNVGHAARMTAEAEDNEAVGCRGHF